MGGNIFPLAESIKKEYIDNTLSHYIKELQRIFPKATHIFETFETVGSAGKLDVSGDIDLTLNITHFKPYHKKIKLFNINTEYFKIRTTEYTKRARTSTVDQLKLKTFSYFIAKEIALKSTKILTSPAKINIGQFFTAAHQYDENDNKLDKRVQIDITIGNPEWLQFSYFSNSLDKNIKGLHRTQLLLSLFSNQGYTFNHLYGIKNKHTGKIEANTVSHAKLLLNNLYNTEFPLSCLFDYTELHNFIQQNLSVIDYISIMDIYLKILDSTRVDVPYDLHDYWIHNKTRLNLTGKFLPESSVLK